jgi:DNA invertase Pin-like site-specific DNA recombinase
MSDAILNPIDLQNEAIFQDTVKVYLSGSNHNSEMPPKQHEDVAVYLRVSSKDQTVESQLSALRPFLRVEGYDVDDCSLYIDDGVSAKAYPNFTDRPAGFEMMKDVENGKIRTIYGFKVNRFFRRVANGAAWMDLMAAKHPHVNVKTVDCFASISQSAGRMMWHTLLMVAEMENEQKSEATKGGMQRIQEQLGKSSHAVFGWFWNEDEQRMNPCWHQQAVIKHVHDAWNDDKGQSFASICRDLTKWGIKTATGRDFTPATVRRMVKKPSAMQDQLHQFTPPKTFPVNIKRGIKPRAES